MCFAFNDEWYSMHIGDSRCYSFSQGLVTRTRDHSPVEMLFRSGLIDEYEMNTHPMKNMISAYIGGGHADKLSVNKIVDPERILLGSDSIFVSTPTDVFEGILKKECEISQLVDYALTYGSRDNISGVLIQTSDVHP